MGRPSRIHYPGALYHVIARGNNRQKIFLDSLDRKSFEALLLDGVQRFAHRVHAYCWMSNHVHLASEVGEVSISRIMHNLCSRYARGFNQRHGRSGHLFEKRFRSPLVRDDEGARRLLRYIHLNPCRAGLGKMPEDYPWSSHHAYLHGGGPAFLETDWMTGLFGEGIATARSNLRDFVGADPTETLEPAEGLNTPRLGIEGNLRIHASIAPPALWKSASLHEIVQCVTTSLGAEWAQLSERSLERSGVECRGVIAWLVREGRSHSLCALASLWGRHVSALSRAAARIDIRMRTEPEIREVVCGLMAQLDRVVAQRARE